MSEYDATDPVVFLRLIGEGNGNRTTHATEANDVSSRSHAICQVMLRGRSTGRLRGKLSLVDLAGSERGSDTKSHNRQRRTESSDINTSLLALKECIRAIGAGGGRVPCRQSKLTLLLKDCFVSETARTAMIATLSPGSSSADHTVNTLRYADRIKERKVGDVVAPPSTSKAAGSGGRSPAVMQRTGERHLEENAAPRVRGAVSDEEEDEAVDEAKRDDRGDDDGGRVEADAMDGMDEEEIQSLSEIDRTVKELLDEKEVLLNLNMASIHENASLLTEEGLLLERVQS